MTIEWLEEQLSKVLAQKEELLDIISELLPISEENFCIGCEKQKNFLVGIVDFIHEDGSLCLGHPHYDRARKVLNIEIGAQA